MFVIINYTIYNILNIKKIKYKKMLTDICVSSLFTMSGFAARRALWAQGYVGANKIAMYSSRDG